MPELMKVMHENTHNTHIGILDNLQDTPSFHGDSSCPLAAAQQRAFNWDREVWLHVMYAHTHVQEHTWACSLKWTDMHSSNMLAEPLLVVYINEFFVNTRSQCKNSNK